MPSVTENFLISRQAQLAHLEDEVPNYYENLVEIARLHKPSRRTVIGGVTAGALLGLAGAGLRVESINRHHDWMRRKIPELLYKTVDNLSEIEVGIYSNWNYYDSAQLANSVDPMRETQLLKEATGSVKLIGVFFNLESVNFSGEVAKLAERVNKIHEMGATPVISIHMYSYPNQMHPFDVKNTRWMIEHATKLKTVLDQFEFPLKIRLFYEMNLRAGFLYGAERGLEQPEQELGFRRVSQLFSKVLHDSKYERVMCFSPSIQSDFTNYYEPGIFDEVGFDIYSIYRDSVKNILTQHTNLIDAIQQLIMPEYLLDGEQSFDDPIDRAIKAFKSWNLPFGIYEIGSFTQDPVWLIYVILKVIAEGGEFFCLFSVDKSIESLIKVFETDWRLKEKIILAIGELTKQLDQRQRLPNELNAQALLATL